MNGIDDCVSFTDMLSFYTQTEPCHVCIRTPHAAYTWSDVTLASQNIAEKLYDLGVRQGSRVAICGYNSFNWVATFFALQMLGARAFLLNSALTRKELFDFIDIGGITHFCYGEMEGLHNLTSYMSSLFEKGIGTIDIRKTQDYLYNINSMNICEFFASPDVDEPNIVLFTSGSTGKVKTIATTVRNITEAVKMSIERVHYDNNLVICGFLPMFHIFGLITEIAQFQVLDGELYIPEDMHTASILSAIDSGRCTFMCSVPTMMIALINNTDFSSDRVRSLGICMLGGAPLQESHIDLLHEKFPYTQFVSAYGMTEFCPISLTDRYDSFTDVASSAGKPCTDVNVKICDITNEIAVKSGRLSVYTYENNIVKIAAAADGWFHTGDIGYIDAEGRLHITGRIKDIIIRGGENVLPCEVSSAILEEGSVADAAVFGIYHRVFGEEVCAALVMKKGAYFYQEQMMDYLSARLARHKIPTKFFVRSELPLLKNGKIDIAQLKTEYEKTADS